MMPSSSASMPAAGAGERAGDGPHARPSDPLQIILVGIWEDVLGRRPIGVRQSFAALGGDAALAASMVDRVEKACGERLPANAVSLDLTVERLAELLKQAAGPSRPRVIVARNLGADPAARSVLPFFFAHGDVNGGGFYCLRLAGHLGGDQPFYALPSQGADGRPLPPSIEAMAVSQLEMLRALRPQGPYWLGGYCHGAHVTFEVARLLEAQGERVERLVLVAPVLPAVEAPRYRGALGRLEELGWYYRGRFRALGRLGGRERAAAVLRALARRAPFARRPAPPPPRSARGATSASGRTAVFEAYRPLMRAYRPGAYRGPVAIVWPEDEPERLRLGSDRRWRRAVPQRRAVLVPGEHLTCITEHAAALAAAMRALLRPDSPAR
jgi:thioesterase domain-containing protein